MSSIQLTNFPKQKPKAASARRAWQKNIDKSALAAQRILNSSGDTDVKESRANLIADDLVHVGLAEEAVKIVDQFTQKDKKKYVYESIAKKPGNASANTIEKIALYFSEGSLGDNEFFNLLSQDVLANFKAYTDPQLLKIFVTLLTELDKRKQKADQELKVAGNDEKKKKAAEQKQRDALGHKEGIIDILTRVLVVRKGFRKLFSDWAWANNQENLLMDILYKEDASEDGFFNEPDYGQLALDLAKSDGSKETFILKMSDMAWVYENKQKFIILKLIGLVKTQLNETLAPPRANTSGRFQFSAFRTWIDTNTEKIGAALKKAHATEPDKIARMYELIADMAFHHVDRGDVKPDAKKIGTLGHLGASDPDLMRIKSDCDVLALYASRLLFASGFSPIGFMAIDPVSTGYLGHAAALLQHGSDFYIAENKEVFKIGALAKADAIKRLKEEILKTISDSNGPDDYKVYYGDSEFVDIGKEPNKQKRVKAPDAVYDTQDSGRRKDLEP